MPLKEPGPNQVGVAVGVAVRVAVGVGVAVGVNVGVMVGVALGVIVGVAVGVGVATSWTHVGQGSHPATNVAHHAVNMTEISLRFTPRPAPLFANRGSLIA